MSERNALCGFECEFAKTSDVWGFFAFPDIEFDHYYFKVVDADIFSHCKGIVEEFHASHFQEMMQKFFVGEALVLHLYPENTNYEEIDSYEDYLKSKCEMIILFFDFYYMEVYCKNQTWLQKLMHTAINIPGTIVDEKYENTDTRTTMYV